MRYEQLALEGLAAHMSKPMICMYWRDEEGRDWVAHAQ